MSLVIVMRIHPKVFCPYFIADCASLWRVQTRRSANGWQVSSLGRVQDSRARVSYGSPQSGGYLCATIDGKRYSVHRLVAAAFIGGSTPERWQVNHIDGDRRNNQVANLEYVSHAENIRHSFNFNMNRKKPEIGRGKAVQWRRLGESNWSTCSSQLETARVLGLPRKSVSLCYWGKTEGDFSRGMYFEIKCAKQEPDPLAGEDWKRAIHPNSGLPIQDLMVSSFGRVWSKSSRHDYVSFGSNTADGYRAVKKAGHNFFVHRLVAATFLGKAESSELVVNHLDSNRANNHMENLEYATRSQNLSHAYRQGRRSTGSPKALQARTLTPEGPWLDFESIQEAGLHTGLCPQEIGRLCRGLSTGGISWEFRRKEAEELEGEEWRPVVLEGARAPMKQHFVVD
ncbi:unnamed protein product [Symbiodinium necroappetens]|uniref:HNH nuclease domain-containing protein n=1 Tax=Symbiodinium necroappetens TaxID=1628268 RepID=A0A813BRM3_9DINO|nr:unnamed protein product [Symbiodinium sp. CCMP2456]CAE7921024.1 unnamed protein product [Symbiodinium necroappetens]